MLTNSKIINLNINDKLIPITVVYKNYTNPKITLKLKNEQLFVFCSLIFSDETIIDFVKNSSFAKNNFNILKKQKWLSIDENYFWFLGKKYLYSIIKSNNSWFIVSGSLVLFFKNNENKYSSIQKAVITSFKKYVEKRTLFWANKMEVPTYKIEIRSKSTAWGTNYKREKIHYSSHLVPFSENIIDYVIIHELAHHHCWAHNAFFWNIVKKFCPNYKDMQNKLNNYEYF